jgi:hypothetical protein
MRLSRWRGNDDERYAGGRHWFGVPGEKAASTVTVVPGLHADFDAAGKLIGIEALDASEILGGKVQFEVDLSQSRAEQAAAMD